MKTQILALFLIIAVFTACTTGNVVLDGSKPKLDMYVMSQCPPGIQAENALAPVLEKLGNNIDFNLEFIGSGNINNLQSLHGINEVKGDIVELCAKKYNQDKYFKFIICQNKAPSSIPNNWESCAKESKLDVNSIKTCYEGEEGKNLLVESFAKSDEAGASGSPTILINNNPYRGKRDTASLLNALCNAYENKKPSACNNIPKPVKIAVTIVNDNKCKTCSTTKIESVIKQLFKGAEIKKVDASSSEGKSLVKDLNLEKVPSIIFDKKITETPEWKEDSFKSAFEQAGSNYKLLDEATGAAYYIDAVKRANYEKALAMAKQKVKDDLGIKTNDNKPQIDFFVMSYCPPGNQAEESIAPVYSSLKNKAIFNPHYVIYGNYQGGGSDYCLGNGKYCSMHGIQELNQDVRELCVNKYFGTKSWFDFALAMNTKCTYKNADSCWENVAKSLSLDTEKIKTCQATEALTLLKKEQDLSNALEVQGSPTIFIEGESYEGARTTNGYLFGLCNAFTSKPSECSSVLAETQTATTNSAGCGA